MGECVKAGVDRFYTLCVGVPSLHEPRTAIRHRDDSNYDEVCVPVRRRGEGGEGRRDTSAGNWRERGGSSLAVPKKMGALG